MLLISTLLLLSYTSIIFSQSCIQHLSESEVILDNGIRVPSSKVQKHFKAKLRYPQLTHALYLYDERSGVLTSCTGNLHTNIKQLHTTIVPDSFNPPAQITVDGHPHPPMHDGPTIKLAGRVQFVHDPVSDELLAVIAPGLNLCRIHSQSGHLLLIDAQFGPNARKYTVKDENRIHPLSQALFAAPSEKSGGDANTHKIVNFSSKSVWKVRSSSGEICRARRMVLEIILDYSFCAMYDHNVALAVFQFRAALADILSMFDSLTCVVITAYKYTTYCKNKLKDPFAKPSSLNECSSNSTSNCRARHMLRTVRNHWLSTNENHNSSDAVLLLSGYDDGTKIPGAAYVGGVCSLYKFGWVNGLESAFIGHMLGHLLGAIHSRYGLMKANISPTQNLVLSKSSARSIRKYVRNRTTGWCLSINEWWRNAGFKAESSATIEKDIDSIFFSNFKNSTHVMVWSETGEKPRKL